MYTTHLIVELHNIKFYVDYVANTLQIIMMLATKYYINEYIGKYTVKMHVLHPHMCMWHTQNTCSHIHVIYCCVMVTYCSCVTLAQVVKELLAVLTYILAFQQDRKQLYANISVQGLSRNCFIYSHWVLPTHSEYQGVSGFHSVYFRSLYHFSFKHIKGKPLYSIIPAY